MRKINFKVWQDSGTYNLDKEKRSYLKLALTILVIGIVAFFFVGCSHTKPSKPTKMFICQDGNLYLVEPWTKWEKMGVEPCKKGKIEFNDRLELRPDLKGDSDA